MTSKRTPRPGRLPTGPKRTSHPVPGEGAPEDPLEELAAIQGRLSYWERELRVAVAQARRRRYQWAEIGDALGISRQAAHLRFGPGGAQDVTDVV
jgi:hypothetical protein